MRWAGRLLSLVVSLGVLGAEEPPRVADEPVDREFVQKAAQEYYDALIKKNFARTATREVFSVQSSPPDLPAYQKAMEAHPYVGADRILAVVSDLDASGAYVDLKITRGGAVQMSRMTWSRTGSPKKWVVAMTKMTLAGMPGFQVYTGDEGGMEKEQPAKPTPRIESKVIFKEQNRQEGLVTGAADGPVRFVHPPKVMPAAKLGKAAYVLGFIENTGKIRVDGIAIKVTVKSEKGEILETTEFHPSKRSLDPGAEIKFDGALEHLDPKRTEFTLTWDPPADH